MNKNKYKGGESMEKAKRIVISSIGVVVLIAIYNILLFTLYNNFTANFWVGYAFIMASMLVMLASFIITFASDRSGNVVGLPLTTLSGYYFVIEAILGSLLMFFKVSFVAAFLPQIVLFLIFFAVYVIAVLRFYSLPKTEENK